MGTDATEVRFLIGDKNDNEAATNKMPLSDTFELFEAQSFDFNINLGPQPPDCFQIIGMGIEFFAETPGSVGPLRFQMDDVEVPESWSQLATDIVVSKYFRKANVPEIGKETSVRQVVRRITSAIHDHGEKQG